MANTNAPFGLRPVGHLNGSPYNGAARLYFIDSTDTAGYNVGDLVVETTTTDGMGTPGVTLFGTRESAASSGVVRGVIVGFGTLAGNSGGQGVLGADAASLDTVQIPATKTKDYYVWVCDDPTVVYEAQTDSVAATAFNKCCHFYPGALPSAPVYHSQSYVLGSTANTTATFPIKLIGAPNRADNDVTAAYAKVYCILNTASLAANTAGV